jgi:hypothetical protein
MHAVSSKYKILLQQYTPILVVILVGSRGKNEEKIKVDAYAYILTEFLGVAPIAREEKVTIVIDVVSRSNHAVHRQWPFEASFYLGESEGEDLQGGRKAGGITLAASRCRVCEVHRADSRCKHQCKHQSELVHLP